MFFNVCDAARSAENGERKTRRAVSGKMAHCFGQDGVPRRDKLQAV
jgi:hypothetical protein